MVVFGKMANNDNTSEMRKEIFQIMSEKSKIETEIQQFYQILSTNNVGMHDPLVDSEGFPRNDIDVYQVRTARHKIICLQNDHKKVMERIEEGLHKLHESAGSGPAAGDEPMDQSELEPFATVSLVSADSPADLCGLLVNDLILEFGSVNRGNFKSMEDVLVVVRHSVRQRVSVVVRRAGRNSPLTLDLTPQPWSGQGLLGCKITPFTTETIER